MSITVSRLCADPTLGLTVVAGAARASPRDQLGAHQRSCRPHPLVGGWRVLMTLALNLDLTAAWPDTPTSNASRGQEWPRWRSTPG